MKRNFIIIYLLVMTASLFSKQKNDAYLMAYFTDEDHSLHFAVSMDGYSFTAVNDNYPIICGDTIAEQHGVRDPYIMHAPNGEYYVAMTDLHVLGKKAGVRTTQWERPNEKYGWGNNKNIVLMKSRGVINWSHSLLRVNEIKGFENIGCDWNLIAGQWGDGYLSLFVNGKIIARIAHSEGYEPSDRSVLNENVLVIGVKSK